MKFSHRLLFLAMLTSACTLAGANSLYAQSSVLEANRNLRSSGPPAPPPGSIKTHRPAVEATASIDFGNGGLVTVSSRQGGFDRVGLRHDQTVDIAVQYPTASAGETIGVEALDGGQLVVPGKSLTIGSDGTIRFKFRAGHQPGAYQIVLRKGNKEIGLQFWVRDDEHPKNNPPVINAEN
jgi:hypothetical protein